MWQGTVTLRPGRMTYAGRLGVAHQHRHAAVQLVLATAEPVLLRDESGAEGQSRAAVIPSGAAHEVISGSAGLMVWIDAHCLLGQALTARVRRTRQPLGSVAAWVAAARPLLDNGVLADETPSAMIDQVLATLAEGGRLRERPLHPALRHAVAVLPTMLDRTVQLGQVAVAAGISASRLGHLFRDELGLPFRAYVRWVRLRHAIDHARLGATLTEAAHAAGFADSAHLTRVCHEMFGLPPSLLARGVDWREAMP
ncbi:AraC-like DNA-binding protein [Prauserella shujinwangii]|uniref:AraC-like DNA-binding protein n=1 Tax=Prauserella shujinwangii TaxID=1453103 RepID=A0A2T0LTE0_9PSEU|nr:helix-turn-helix domain-containing protein [Prauserella shujinwangii]PRX46946.1 AraC-like DNA-binding protein [Prauserella shujinwangii]